MCFHYNRFFNEKIMLYYLEDKPIWDSILWNLEKAD